MKDEKKHAGEPKARASLRHKDPVQSVSGGDSVLHECCDRVLATLPLGG
jgi:hypothetical protein